MNKMAEFRTNEVTEEQILIVESRLKRPMDFQEEEEIKQKVSFNQNCPFCVGNEEQTPSEIYRVGEPWEARVVENKFPIVNGEGDIKGYHYVVIETTDHNKNLHEMNEDEIFKVFKSYVKVSEELYKKDGVQYVQIFKNYRKEAGASLEHPHSQMIAITKVPDKIKTKKRKAEEYYNKTENCLVCKTIKEEIESKERVVYYNEDFIIYCPYISVFPYEMVIAPIHHRSSILEMSDLKIQGLSSMVLRALRTLERNVGDIPYNMYIDFIEKEKEYYHYQIRICPRLSIHAGFEIATGLFTNVISPETAAKKLRGK